MEFDIWSPLYISTGDGVGCLSPTYGLWVWGTGLHIQGVESRAEVWLRAGQSPKNQTPKLQTPEHIAAGIATNGIPRALGFLI